MQTEEELEIDKVKLNPKVRRALNECSLEEKKLEQKETFNKNRRYSALIIYFIIFIAAGLFYYLFGLKIFPITAKYLPLLQKLMVGTMLLLVVLVVNYLIKSFFLHQVENPTTRYNLNRILDLAATLLIFFLVVSILYVNWYTAIVSLGLLSLILGLALQNPLTSFFGWLFILIRKPYEVGDRIKIGLATGDVIEVGYFDTMLWEFHGDYLSSDHPSGRIIRFANAKVFDEYITNYSWPLFPYIWNEIKFFVSYESNFDFISETLKNIAQEEIGEAMARRVKVYRAILQETPVDELEVREEPSIIFRAHDNTWIETVVRYLVEPKESGRIKNRLFSKIMATLRAEPEKVMFPKTNLR